MILTGRPSYIKELVIHKKVNLSIPSPAPCCAAHPAWPSCLCWAAQIPWLQDHVSWLIAAGEPTGCSHRVPAIATPSCSCLDPKVQQEVLMWASFLFDSGNYEQSCSHVRKPYSNLNDQNRVTLRTVGVCMGVLCVDRRPVQICTTQSSQHLKGCKIICTLPSFFTVLDPVSSILKVTLQSPSDFLTGSIMDQYLLAQNNYLVKMTIWKQQDYLDCKWKSAFLMWA